MKIHIAQNGRQLGPFNEEELTQQIERGIVSYDDSAWVEGMAEWQPLRQIVAPASGEPVPPPIPRSSAPPTPPAIGNNGSESLSAAKSEVLGGLIMFLPVASAVLMWFWIGSMSLVQNPGSTLTGLMALTVIATSILMAFEASQLGMGRLRDGKATTGPAVWFLSGLLLWCVALPVYLYSRRKYGVKNYLAGGIFGVLLFFGVGVGMSVAIEQKKAEVQQRLEDASEQLRDLGRQFQNVR